MPSTPQCRTRQSDCTVRAFIALRPSRMQSGALSAFAKTVSANSQARPVRVENVHLTLAFIGELDRQKALQLKLALSAIAFPAPIVWPLTHLGCFGSVLWCAGEPSQEIQKTAALVRALLERQGISYDKKHFKAHITLARNFHGNIPPLTKTLPSLEFSAPTLMLSERDSKGILRYRSL